MIDIEMFWSYVELWVGRNKFSWEELARHCHISRVTLWRRRTGKGELTISQFNCICSGIGLNPLFVLTSSNLYMSPFVMEVK